jgi:hypothetical protein
MKDANVVNCKKVVLVRLRLSGKLKRDFTESMLAIAGERAGRK